MEKYRIITDSTTDLTQELIEELDVTVVPMKFTLGGKEYLNDPLSPQLDVSDFYKRLRGGEFPTTAQVNSEEFIKLFTPVLESGEDILYIAFSSGLSGTYQSALMSARELKEKFPQRRVEVFDSLAASMGEGLIVYHAAKLKASGEGIDGVLAWLRENAQKLCHWFTVDDLNHLKRGGRVSTAAAIVGTMLGIKPVLHVDDEGHLIPVMKVRGRRQSLDELIKQMENTVTNPQEQTVFISHGDSLEDAEYVRQCVQKKFAPKRICLNYIGPIIGAHSGPGTIALFFLGSAK